AAEHARQSHHAAALIMVDALSDQAWANICAAAGRSPDAGTRERLSTILFEEYPVFHYDRKRVARAFKNSKRMLKRLAAFEAAYRTEFTLVDEAARADAVTNTVRVTPDLWAIEGLRKQALGLWLYACAIREAHARRANVQRAWLYNQLCTVWLRDFDAPLTYSVPSRSGPPYGPLIAFILAAAGLVMSEPPSPETVRDAIDRERMERENARQLSLFLADRRPLEPDVPD